MQLLRFSVLSSCERGSFLPSQVFARGKDWRREREGKREEKRKRFLAISCIPFALPEARASSLICFSFRALYSFRLPSFSLLFHRFVSLSLSLFERVRAIKTTASVFSVSENLRGKQCDAGRSILVQKEEGKIKEGGKRKKDALMD